jgi:Fe-S cluster assembly protein SufD
VRMIVTGFFQQVFDRITIESVRDALGEAIGRRVRDLKAKQLAGAAGAA